MNIAPAIAFDSAEREYNEAWNAPSSTRFELPGIDVNKVLKQRYRLSPEQTLTRAMIWDMETRKAWDPLTYIPYVVSQARSWGRMTLRDGSTAILSVVIAAGMDYAAGGTRRRGRFRQRRQADHPSIS